MSDPTDLPLYQSHKKVRALQLASIEDALDGVRLSFSEPGYDPIGVDFKLVHRYRPVPGDYYVVYEDGYASFSPKAAFEAGYTRL